MSAWGNSADRVLLALRDHGPMTRAQIVDVTSIAPGSAGRVLSALTRPMKRPPHAGRRRVHVAGWDSFHDGARNYLRPIYALGDRPDARRPPPLSRRVIAAQHRQLAQQRAGRFLPGSFLQENWNAR